MSRCFLRFRYPFLCVAVLLPLLPLCVWSLLTCMFSIGSGQYTAIVNTSTQVDGITPLEVCLLRRTGGPRFDPQSTRHRGSVLGSVVSTLRSSVRDLGFASE